MRWWWLRLTCSNFIVTVSQQFAPQLNAQQARQRLLVIAPHGSYRTAPFISAAQSLGVQVLIASQGKYSIVSDYVSGLHIDLNDIDTAQQSILDEARHHPFIGVVGTDDITTELASRVAAALSLPHNPLAAIRLARRKDVARQCLAAARVQVPAHRVVELQNLLPEQLRNLVYPVVVKPVALSGSRGVIRADNETELLQAIRRIQNILRKEPFLQLEEQQRLLVEQFIPGEEVAVEAMLYQGKLEILTIFDKPEPLNGPYFEETYYVTPSGQPAAVVTAIQNTLQAACDAYGLVEGPVHAECRINQQGVWVIEIAARTIGGLCGRLLSLGSGYSLEQLVLLHAMGKPVQIEKQSAAAGVLMLPTPAAGILKRVEGLLEAQRVPCIDEVNIQIREGYELVPIPEGSSYLGFIFARADTPAQVLHALRSAHAKLNVVVAPLWKAQLA